MSRIYLDAYDAAVLRFWRELLSRHHASLRRPYATGRAIEPPGGGSDPPKPQTQKKRPAVREDDRA